MYLIYWYWHCSPEGESIIVIYIEYYPMESGNSMWREWPESLGAFLCEKGLSRRMEPPMIRWVIVGGEV